MLQNATLGKKITLGFSTILVLLVVVTGIGIYTLSNASRGFVSYSDLARQSVLAGELQTNLNLARMQVKDFITYGRATSAEQFNEHLVVMNDYLTQAKSEIKDPKRAELVDEIGEYMEDYETFFDDVVVHRTKADNVLEDVLNILGPAIEKRLTTLMQEASESNQSNLALHAGLVMRNLLLARLYVIKFDQSSDPAAVKRVESELGDFDDNLALMETYIKSQDHRLSVSQLKKERQEYYSKFMEMVDAIQQRDTIVSSKLEVIGPEISDRAEQMKELVIEEQNELESATRSNNARASSMIMVFSVGALVLGFVLSFLISSNLTKTLRRTIEGLQSGADQVAAASSQVSTSSQQLAQGAGEQASSLEETSSSLEEIASMARQNADNSEQARKKMEEAKVIVGNVDGRLQSLGTAVEEISESSEDTKNIVKTIEEIAFQTNLLALNAAVEAARAGELGSGFAVVADEVRSLAMRASEAAKNTSLLIENTLVAVRKGRSLTEETKGAFKENLVVAQSVALLVDEIAAASNEQSQGISQINTAIAQMDEVTQMNAANAEESASASEELSSQANEMNEMVDVLVTMVNGSKGNGHVSRPVTRKQPTAHRPINTRRMLKPAHTIKTNDEIMEDIIPLGEEEGFEEF